MPYQKYEMLYARIAAIITTPAVFQCFWMCSCSVIYLPVWSPAMQRGQRIRAVGTENGGGGALVCLFSACSNANTFFQSRTRSIANWTWKRIGWLGPQPAIVVKGGDALRRGHVVRPPG